MLERQTKERLEAGVEERKPQCLKEQKQGLAQPRGSAVETFSSAGTETVGPSSRRLSVTPRAPGRGGRVQGRQQGGLWPGTGSLPDKAKRWGRTWAAILQVPLPALQAAKGVEEEGWVLGAYILGRIKAPLLRTLATSGLTVV